MIRAIRPAAMAQDDASMIAGWNIAPNVEYVLVLSPGSTACGAYLYGKDGVSIIASGAALVGTAQPCVLVPLGENEIGMVDAGLRWHLLLSTTGTESQRTIRIGPAVDLPDEIHPVYGDDDMALARATAAIDAAAHYIDDVTVTCPLGLGAGLGDVVSVPVDGVAVVGQVESVTWTGTPDGAIEQAIVRRHVAIAPEAFVEPIPPSLEDDSPVVVNNAASSGNVFDNDDPGLYVSAVQGLSTNVGVAVAGSNGGLFTIEADGAWTFDPADDFLSLTITDEVDTSVSYHASTGLAESMATITATVVRHNVAPSAGDVTAETPAEAEVSGSVLDFATDADDDTLTVSQVAGSASNVGAAVVGSNGGLFTVNSDGSWIFDPNGEFYTLVDDQTVDTAVSFHVTDGRSEDDGTLTITVRRQSPFDGVMVVSSTTGQMTVLNGNQTITLPDGIQPGDLVFVFISGCDTNDRNYNATGYTELFDLYANDQRDANLYGGYKIMGDPVDATVETTSIFQSYWYAVVYGIIVFRGVDPATPIDVSHSVASGTNSATPNPPAITPVTDRALILSIVSSGIDDDVAQNPAPPAGFDMEIWKDGFGGNAYKALLGVASKEWRDGDGAIDPASWSGISTDNVGYSTWIAVTMALRPAT